VSDLPITHNLSAYHGDTWSKTFRLVRAGAPVNLTGATIECEARAPSGEVAPLTVTIEDPTDGRFNLKLPADLPPWSYLYDVEVTENNGVTLTWIKGTLTVTRDVTNEAA